MFCRFYSLRLVIIYILMRHTHLFRLPTSVVPYHYGMKILVDIDNDFKFFGMVRIKVRSTEGTSKIILHSKDLQIFPYRVKIQETMDWFTSDSSSKSNVTSAIKITGVTYNHAKDFLIINSCVEPGKTYVIQIEYEGVMGNNSKGLYRSHYQEGETEKWLATTQFEPIFARMAFPCFDEPSYKSTFSIKIGRSGKYNSTSNGELIKIKPMQNKDGYYWDIFRKTPKMPTYLVAFIVSDFKYNHLSNFGTKNVPIRIWSSKESFNQFQFASSIASKIYPQLEGYFGMDFPLRKIDFVAVPSLFGDTVASESWGLLSFREEVLMDTNPLKDEIAITVVYQAALQWLNLVTIKWWDQVWIRESLPYAIIDTELGKIQQWDSAGFFSLKLFQYFKMELEHSSSLKEEVEGSLKSILRAYDNAENKGPMVMRMLKNLVGPKAFQNGIAKFLQQHEFGTCDEDELWSAIEGTNKENISIKAVSESWLRKPGYPVIEIERNYERRTAVISQRELPTLDTKTPKWWVEVSYIQQDHDLKSKTKSRAWWISISLKYKGLLKNIKAILSPNYRAIIDGIPFNKYVLANVDLEAPVRVNYDHRNWKILADSLKSKNFGDISVFSRNRLVDDICFFSQTGQVKYEIIFNLLEYLNQEILDQPWQSALIQFDFLDIQLRQFPIHANFKEYMKLIIEPQFKRLLKQTEKTAFDEYFNHKTRMMRDSCKYGVVECLDMIKNLFPQFSTNKTNFFRHKMRDVILGFGIQQGNLQIWDQFFNAMVNLPHEEEEEKKVHIRALSFTTNNVLLEKLLNYTLSHESGKYKQYAFQKVLSNEFGFEVARKFLFAHFKTLYFSDEPNNLTYLRDFARYVTREKDYDNFKNLTDGEQFTPILKKNLFGYVKEAQQIIDANIQWHQKYYDDVERELNKYPKDVVEENASKDQKSDSENITSEMSHVLLSISVPILYESLNFYFYFSEGLYF